MKGFKSIRRVIRANVLFLSSGIISFVLWIFIQSSTIVNKTITIPLEYVLPSGKALRNLAETEVSIDLYGPRIHILNYIETLATRNHSIIVDAAKFKRRKGFIPVPLTSLKLPIGIEVKAVSPNKVEVDLERKILKEVPIRIQTTELDESVKLVKSKLTVSKAMIEGPVSVMRETGFLVTEKIDLSKLSTSGEVEVGLGHIDDRISLIDEKPILYSYSLKAKQTNLTLGVVPIRFISTKNEYKAETNFASLELLVSDGVNSSIIQRQVSVLADVPEDFKGAKWVNLKVNLPEDVHLLKISPQKIRVFRK